MLREPIVDSGKVFRVLLDEGYALDWPSKAVTVEFRYVHRERHELFGELEVRCDWAGADQTQGILFTGNFNASSLQGRSTLGKHLAVRSHVETKDFDWVGLLEDFCRRCVLATRKGTTAVDLCDVPLETGTTVWDAGGIPLLSRLPVIWFGDGGAAKSYLALYAAGCLAKQGHRVLYADWEFSGSEHRDRWYRLFGEVPPSITYVRCERSMLTELDHLCRVIQTRDIDYVIADSVAFAMAEEGPPEDAKIAVAYFAAIRRMGVGSLHLAHQTKSTEGAEYKPFGSTFWHNAARMTWHLKGVQEGLPADELRVAMYNRKNNVGRLYPAIGWGFDFGPTRTTLQPADLHATGELAKGLPIKERILEELRMGPQTMATLAEELNLKLDSVKKALRRGDGTSFKKVLSADGIQRFGVVNR